MIANHTKKQSLSKLDPATDDKDIAKPVGPAPSNNKLLSP